MERFCGDFRFLFSPYSWVLLRCRPISVLFSALQTFLAIVLADMVELHMDRVDQRIGSNLFLQRSASGVQLLKYIFWGNLAKYGGTGQVASKYFVLASGRGGSVRFLLGRVLSGPVF